MISKNKEVWTAERVLRERELCLDEKSKELLRQEGVRINQYGSFKYEPGGPDDGIPLFEYTLPDGSVWREVFCGRGLCLTTENITEKNKQISDILSFAGKKPSPTP